MRTYEIPLHKERHSISLVSHGLRGNAYSDALRLETNNNLKLSVKIVKIKTGRRASISLCIPTKIVGTRLGETLA